MNSDPFWPLLMYFFIVLLIITVMVGAPALLGERHGRKEQRRPERGTTETYESGITPTGTAHLRIPIQYYLIAMLFVMFDMEAVYLYAWAIVAQEAGWTGFVEASIFIALLTVALVYLWRAGALDWSSQRGTARGRDERRTGKEERGAMVA